MRTVVKVVAVAVVLFGAWRSWVTSPDNVVRPRTVQPPAPSAVASLAQTAEPGLVVVPDVVGLHHAFAAHVLDVTALRLGDVRLKPSGKPWGSVLSQSLEPGASVRARTTIDLVLAKGVIGWHREVRSNGPPVRP